MSMIPNDPFPEYEQYDGLGLAKLVANGEVKATELVEATIARIRVHNPSLNAVIYSMAERARREVRDNEGGGPFQGVPFLLKDLAAEDEGEISSWSSRATADWRSDFTSEMVKRFRRSGLTIVGRTNTPECGIYNVTEPELYGPTRNPWNMERTPGGSSGGSAAAVAAGIVPMAHASDGGGSIRIPASYCGLFGLKPTRGRNPAGPCLGEVWGGLSVEHVLTRSVRDSAAMLDATRGPESGAPYQVRPPDRPYLSEVDSPPGQLKIAWTTEALFGDETDPECVKATENAAQLAESLGHHVEEARPSFDKDALIRAYLLMVCAGVSSEVEELSRRAGRRFPSPADFETTTWMMKIVSDKISATEYQRYRVLIHRLGYQMATFFSKYDILLTPTVARMAAPIRTYALNNIEWLQAVALRWLQFRPFIETALKKISKGPMSATPNTMLFNLTGQPAMSIPLWWSPEGLPVGTQWVGRFGDESTLFRLAAQLEEAQPWFNQRPIIE
ncbi:MAG: amidase [Chloroflexota bacterium]